MVDHESAQALNELVGELRKLLSGEEDPQIRFSVKSLFDEVKRDMHTGLGRIEGKLDQKADKSDLDRLSTHMLELTDRVGDLEKSDEARRVAAATHKKRDVRQTDKVRWLIDVGLGAGLIVVGLGLHL
jgi:hypothetical protein